MVPWMKSRQWMTALGLVLLAAAGLVGWVATRDSATRSLLPNLHVGGQHAPLVDERPLQSARTMAKLASGADERQFAEAAEDAADHEVDLAFHDASLDSANHPPVPTPQNLQYYQHANQSEAQVQTDEERVAQLKKQLASASGSNQHNLQQQLDVTQAQLELDQDESADAKEELIQSGADPGSLIQRQFDEHQAVEHAADEKATPAAASASAIYQSGSLLAQFAAWRALRERTFPVQQARAEASKAADQLLQDHKTREQQIKAEKNQQAPSDAHASAAVGGQGTTTVKSLHQISGDQKVLADLDKRIQYQVELVNTYAGWVALIQSQQRAVMHSMIQSGLWIILILLLVYLASRAIDHYLVEAVAERTRLHTLRAVIRFAVQALGALLILLVIFGAPQQTTTILGLAGAGLTVALKDFIVAFFGWFVLMGKNGLRVGDWVEINGVAGEVVEINLLRTVLLETGNWTDTGHPTGRKVAFVNSYAIEGHFFNFTTSGQWLWDELQITVPPNQDPYPLLDAIQKTVAKETEKTAGAAEEEWKNAASHYKVSAVSAAPVVNLRPTSAGVDIHVRYITRAQERSAIRARLNQALVELLHHRGAESFTAAK
jgi:small-conductance mechanosensitive channel